MKVNGRATEGNCDNCDLYWALAQVSLIISAGFIASTIVPNMLINLRCIVASDKALALALWITFIGTLPFVPFKLIFGVVAGAPINPFYFFFIIILRVDSISDSLCRYYDESGKCILHAHHFGTFLSVACISLMTVAALLTLLVMIFIKDLDLYDEREDGDDDEDEDVDDPVELENLENQPRQQDQPTNQILHSDF